MLSYLVFKSGNFLTIAFRNPGLKSLLSSRTRPAVLLPHFLTLSKVLIWYQKGNGVGMA